VRAAGKLDSGPSWRADEFRQVQAISSTSTPLAASGPYYTESEAGCFLPRACGLAPGSEDGDRGTELLRPALRQTDRGPTPVPGDPHCSVAKGCALRFPECSPRLPPDTRVSAFFPGFHTKQTRLGLGMHRFRGMKCAR
jgi:hypothetical protein